MDDYDEILDFYNRINRKKTETREWCYQKINELMFDLVKNPFRIQIRNSLILILNLFFIRVNLPFQSPEDGEVLPPGRGSRTCCLGQYRFWP